MHVLKIHAQAKFSDDLKVMANYHSGFIVPEYQFITYITEDYIRSFDLCIAKKTHGKNSWEQLYNYPEYGLSLFYSSLGNNEILGKELALSYFFKVNIISKNRFHLFNRTGIGVGYVNRKFDFENNYLNVAVGSHFNFHFNFRIGVNYLLSEKIELNSGLSFDHFSNAKISVPNLGINYLTAYGGLSYRIGEKTEQQEHEIDPHVKKNNIELFTSIGGKYTQTLSSEYNLTSSVSLELTREFFRAIHFGTGIDLFYDSSVESQLESNGKEYKDAYRFQTGIHISQEFVYNRISIILQEGIYLFLTDMVDENLIYTKGIIKYKITEGISVRLSMKSYFHILDYPELGIGFKF